jgi:hypothetical protein
MPQYLLKLKDKKRDYFFVWSTVVDAPITFGMTVEELKDWYQLEYGRSGMKNFQERLERTIKNGTSALWNLTAKELIRGNRAGDHEKTLTEKQIIEQYKE